MPNWCYNRVTVEGPAPDLAAFQSAIVKADGKASVLSNLVPRPDDIGDNWYEWSLNNWGTKWEDDMDISSITEPWRLILSGDTAWAPPIPGYVMASEKFPTLIFTMKWNEPGMCFMGAAVVKAGSVLAIHEVDGPDYPAYPDEVADDDDALAKYMEQQDDMMDLCESIAEQIASTKSAWEVK